MFSARWKFLIASIIAYQALLTWCLFNLVDTAAYLAWTDCDHCRNHLFGFIRGNQGGYDIAGMFSVLTVLLVVLNVIVWMAPKKADPRKKADPPPRPVTLTDGTVWIPQGKAAGKDADTMTLSDGTVWARKSKDADSGPDAPPA